MSFLSEHIDFMINNIKTLNPSRSRPFSLLLGDWKLYSNPELRYLSRQLSKCPELGSIRQVLQPFGLDVSFKNNALTSISTSVIVDIFVM